MQKQYLWVYMKKKSPDKFAFSFDVNDKEIKYNLINHIHSTPNLNSTPVPNFFLHALMHLLWPGHYPRIYIIIQLYEHKYRMCFHQLVGQSWIYMYRELKIELCGCTFPCLCNTSRTTILTVRNFANGVVDSRFRKAPTGAWWSCLWRYDIPCNFPCS